VHRQALTDRWTVGHRYIDKRLDGQTDIRHRQTTIYRQTDIETDRHKCIQASTHADTHTNTSSIVTYLWRCDYYTVRKHTKLMHSTC